MLQRVTPKGICLWRMSLEGCDPIQLTTGEAEFQPVVSADSRWGLLLLVRFRPADRAQDSDRRRHARRQEI
ncbi:MAG: hypothetical protein ABI818_15460 [Acidobacteriota bacterium]